MKERGIIFSAPMVMALLTGKKTQTRRVVKPQPQPEQPIELWRTDTHGMWMGVSRLATTGGVGVPETGMIRCPYGAPGDRLWVRETWQTFDPHPDGDLQVVGAERLSRGRRSPRVGVTNNRPIEWTTAYRADGELEHPVDGPARWRPSIFMLRWASRITLEITAARVERVQDISEADILAEGVDVPLASRVTGTPWTDIPHLHVAWRRIWEHINGPESWDANPWVWALTFKRHEAP